MTFATKFRRKNHGDGVPDIVFPVVEEGREDSRADDGAGGYVPGTRLRGILLDDHIIVEDQSQALWLYMKGCYGKGSRSRGPSRVVQATLNDLQPIKSRRTQKSTTSSSEKVQDVLAGQTDANFSFSQWKEPLSQIEATDNDGCPRLVEENGGFVGAEQNVLGWEETFFLAWALDCLSVQHNEITVSCDWLWQFFSKRDPHFPANYSAYHYLRGKGWVTRSGLKYAANYVIYSRGPTLSHSSFAVLVKTVRGGQLAQGCACDIWEPIKWQEMVSRQRMAEGVVKDFLLLTVTIPEHVTDTDLQRPAVIGQFDIQENVLRRWKPTETRQAL